MPILAKRLSYQVFTWGALAGQLGLVLELGELEPTGSGSSPSGTFKDPVDILAAIDSFEGKCRHFRVQGITEESFRTSEDTGEELFALGRAAQNRGMLVSVEHMFNYYPPWFSQVPYKIQIVFSGCRVSTECQEVWYLVKSGSTPDLEVGRIPQERMPVMFAHFHESMSTGDILGWFERSRHIWGYLWANSSGRVLRTIEIGDLP